MFTKPYKMYFISLIFVFSLILPLFAQGNGTVKPYSAQAVALKGQTNTDITLTFFTNNAAKFPIPAELKKLQIKIRNQAGEVSYIHNAKVLGLTGNVYKTSIAGPQNHNVIEFQAHIKTAATKNEEIVTGTVVTKLYPNFKLESLSAPSEKKINEPFNIEAFITETNLQTGGTCRVSLYKGDNLVASFNNVAVPVAGNVSVVFGNLTHNVVGVQSYSVVVDNCVPGDYNSLDNSQSVSINFTNPVTVTQSYYWFSYYKTNNYLYTDSGTNTSNGQVVFNTHHSGDWEGFEYGVYNYMSANVDGSSPLSAAYKIETSDNRVISGSFENLSSYYSYPDYQYYSSFDPVNFVYFEGYVSNWGFVQAYIYRYRSNNVYYHNALNGYNYHYENHDPLNTFIDENSQLKVSLVATYNEISWGGGVVFNIAAPQNYVYNYNYTYYDYYYGSNIDYQYSYSYNHTYNYGNGVTDVNILPKVNNSGDDMFVSSSTDIPTKFGIDQNYPNPFNPATTIKYALPQASFVTLKVFNITGQEVATLVNQQVAAGNHTVKFDASGLASGTYIYRIQAGNNVKSNKMLLIK